MYGFSRRYLWSVWVVAAAVQSGLLLLADHADDGRLPGQSLLSLAVFIVVLASTRILRSLQEPDGHEVVTAATVVSANTFAFGLIIVAALGSDEGRGASYEAIIITMAATFVAIVAAFHLRRLHDTQPTAARDEAAGSTSV